MEFVKETLIVPEKVLDHPEDNPKGHLTKVVATYLPEKQTLEVVKTYSSGVANIKIFIENEEEKYEI